MKAVDLAVTEQGAGMPVVILHGLFGRRRNWAGIQRSLAEKHRIVAADLRNHGDSPWDAAMNYGAMANDVARLIEQIGEPSVVIGHSMGGKTAMTLALTRPELVRALCVVDVAPVPYDHDYDGYIRAMRSLPLSNMQRRSEADALLQGDVPDPGVRAFLLQNLGQTPDGLVWQANLDAIEAGMPSILDFPDLGRADYGGPTLFMPGGNSHYVRADHASDIERMFPKVEFMRIDGAGHWVHAEKPGEVTAGLSGFLDRVSG